MHLTKQAHRFGVTFFTVLFSAAGTVLADAPFYDTPHGMLFVEADHQSGKLFSNRGAVDLNGSATTNALGQTILFHGLNPFNENGTRILGGIADRDGAMLGNNATASSPTVFTDIPGFTTSTNLNENFVPVDHLMQVSFHNSIQYFNPNTGAWTDPVNNEQIRVYDFTFADDTDGPPQFGPGEPLEVIIDGTTSGFLGKFNLEETKTATGGGIESAHAHLGFELSVTDGTPSDPSDNTVVPTPGAYMIELTMSALERTGTDPHVFEQSAFADSDSIFFLFDYRMDETSMTFTDAVNAAEQLPEPSTAAIVAVVGLGVIGLRRRGRAFRG